MSGDGLTGRIGRRGLLAGVAGGAVGAGAGFVLFTGGDGGGGTRTIETVEADGDGESELGELRYALQESRIDVETMTYDDTAIGLTYASRADAQNYHQREVTTVVEWFTAHVTKGGEGERLEATIRPGYDGQPNGYHVEREWVLAHDRGDIDELGLLRKVLATQYRLETETG